MNSDLVITAMNMKQHTCRPSPVSHYCDQDAKYNSKNSLVLTSITSRSSDAGHR